MANDSKHTDVGARYALALFGLALDTGSLDAVESDLKSLAAACAESAELRSALASPVFSAEAKGKVLTAIGQAIQASPVTLKFIGVLAANRRAAALPATIAAFRRLSAAHRGVVAAEVTSAMALTADQASAIQAALAQALGKEPEITTRVDPTILGGLKVRVGSRLFDASLRSKLDSLKFALKRA